MLRLPPAAAFTSLALAAACAGSQGSMRSVIQTPPPVTAPARFAPADSTLLIAPADTMAGGGCLSPLVDRIQGIEIVLFRSESGLGDYQAPSGAYGLRDEQLLRLECNTGEVVGVVRR